MPKVRVAGLPAWVDVIRLLGGRASGSGDAGGSEQEAWTFGEAPDGGLVADGELDVRTAADLDARLRGIGLDGRPLEVKITPRLPRAAVRAARAADARRRRDTTPGFLRKGARLDDEGRMSLTPEAIAMAIAASAGGRPVIDATAGCGGDAIAFARSGCPVVAIERDAGRLSMARHNARLHGVEDRIEFVYGDAVERALEAFGPGADGRASLPNDARPILYVDAPWGADWNRAASRLDDLPLLASLVEVAPRTRAVELWAKVPPSFEVASLDRPRVGRAGPSTRGATAEAYFGEAPGDRRRVKLVVVRAPIPRTPVDLGPG